MQSDKTQALEAIRKADEIFHTVPLSADERSIILQRTSNLLANRKEEFASLITKEAGKPITYSRIEVDRAVFTFAAASAWALRSEEEIYPNLLDAPNAVGRKVLYSYFPVGVALAITPFNFPLNLVAHKLAPAIAAGNTIVLKPAPQATLTAYLLADVLKEAGLPDGWLNVISCENDVAEAMVTDDRVKVLSFTGSAAVGWYLKSLVPKKKVTLELGGNGAVIVDDVADIDALIKSLIVAGFYYAGQVCISLQKLFIRTELYDEVIKKFVDAAREAVVGDPSDEKTLVGPMISPAAAEKSWSWVEEAVAKGAAKLCGEFRKPNIITPTILENVPLDCKAFTEEIFAPVVIAHRYDNIDSVIQILNKSRYGLQAGLYSTDPETIKKVYTNLEVGGLIVGDTNTFRIDTMPYGGVKDSGFGREGVEFAMREMMEVKVLCQNLDLGR